MPLIALADMPSGPLLGLDPGSKTVGVAAAGAERLMAAPVETVHRTKFAADAARIFTLYDERNCTGMVVGLPLNMDGSEGPRAQSARAFVRNLLAVRDIPVALHDERLSTAAVEERLIAAGMKRERRKQVIDAHAAAWILQSALDRLSESKPA
ncbi:MAG: Holliday junction resolvase RuvX [Maricaulaceae bacterium]|nr:Holliday junction resolvase RuvX [Maricaulaceae bacterium]